MGKIMSPPIIHHDIDLSNEAEEDVDNNRHDNNEDTGDFSSYWQSIPDPPMFDTGSAPSSFKTSSSTVSNNNNNFSICQDDNIGDYPKDNNHPIKHVQQSSLLTRSACTVTAVDASNDQKSAAAKKRLRDVTNNQTQQASISTQKKKTRRSLLLPCDNNESSTADAADFKSFSCNSSSQPDAVAATKITASSSMSFSSSHSNNDKQTQQRLIQLVREYCALPTTHNNHQRVHSQQARDIERLSSYPMPGTKFHIPMTQTETASNAHDDDNANNNSYERKEIIANTKTKVTLRQEFILHLKPIVQEMEHRRETDLMESRSATQCEMRKNKGRCYYVDVGTGEEVDPREYERRYLRWIEGRRVERLENNRRRSGDDDFGKSGKNGEEFMLPSPQLKEAEEEGNSDCESSFDMDQSVNMDDSVMSSAASSVNDSMSEVDTANMNTASAAQIIAPATAAAATSTSTTTSRIDASTDSSTNDINDNSCNSNSGSSILGLPVFPPSNDTRVLEARTKLWRAIDVALETYSKEILAIQQGR